MAGLRHHTRSLFHYCSASKSPAPLTIGIRREDPSRIWERRCPITPHAVEDLIHTENIRVLIQECDRRVFSTHEFVKAGAQVHSTLSPAHILLGIKETPLNELMTSPVATAGTANSISHVSRTHLMFSHTTKGQPYNMPLLARFLAENAPGPLSSKLIDYELLTGEGGKRTVGFGWFAGVAGALEALSAMAYAQLQMGVASPFIHTPRPHMHASIPSLRASLRGVGEEIIAKGTPKSLGPFIVGMTGTGKVSEGVLSILHELPIVSVKSRDLPLLVNDSATDLHKVYLVHALPGDYLSRVDGSHYDREDYYEHPELYQSNFCLTIAPYLTLFLNGGGWSPSFPRLMTNEQLTIALTRAQEIGPARFTSIGDITCDLEGGLEFVPRASTLSEPFFYTRPVTLPAHLPSVQIMSIDILPASLPLDASQHFSSVLTPYVRALIHQYRGESNEVDAPYLRALGRATVAENGELQGDYKRLDVPLQKWKSTLESGDRVMAPEEILPQPHNGALKKRVLMLGSGMVAGPAVDEICKRPDVELIVASNALRQAQRIARPHCNAKAIDVDMSDKEKLSKLVHEADLVISLLPVSFHPVVGDLCIQNQKHLVTASYISPAMSALHERAQAADVLLLNEIGLDPGIDHCTAIELITRLKAQNKKIISFSSFCGGLPAPECSDVPLGYKFSWSPRGVLNAALNGARFKLNNETLVIPGEDILTSSFPDVPISNVIKLEGIANRDSLHYASDYELGTLDGLRTVLRGTLRYPGYSELLHSFKLLGFLDDEYSVCPDSWTSFASVLLQKRLGLMVKPDLSSIVSALLEILPSSRLDSVLDALNWLSLIPGPLPSSDLPLLPAKPMAPIELFTIILAHKLRYNPSERDLVILSHEIVAVPSDVPLDVQHRSEERYTSSLVTYGSVSSSAMSRCVGLPVAFAALNVLDGGVKLRGVHGPKDASVYQNVLEGLKQVGLDSKETVKRGSSIDNVLWSGLKGRNHPHH